MTLTLIDVLGILFLLLYGTILCAIIMKTKTKKPVPIDYLTV